MGIGTKLQKKKKKKKKPQKKKEKKKTKQNKTASPPVQDFYPDLDRVRGTMLYPLSCGELAMHGRKILRLYVTSGVRTARNNVKMPICGRKPTDTPANILDWYKMGIATKLRKNH